MRLHGGLLPRRCVELASLGEAHGFDSLWFAENPLERGTLATLGACALATTRIELGIGVWNPYLRAPAQIAMDASALDELSQGRLALGLGSGLAAPIQKLGIDNSRPLAALKECFATVRALLRGEEVNGTKLSYKTRADLPLLMAARGPQALALAGRIADGLMVSNMCPPGFAKHAASIARPKRLVQYAPCAVGPDRAKAQATMKPVLTGLLKTFWNLAQRVPAARDSLVTHSGIPESVFASGEPDERLIEAFTVTGDADDIRRRLDAYREAGVTDLVLTLVGPDPVHDMAYLLRAART
ncbi:MAG TPA: LLM class flavin-dependent oxidoreductase [Reyranella sp.]|nr:LLM class flavin-dependent oxidoreductase [Reyranella sp.]